MALRMRPSADPRAPGIYQSFDTVIPPPLTIANTRIAGFAGITEVTGADVAGAILDHAAAGGGGG